MGVTSKKGNRKESDRMEGSSILATKSISNHEKPLAKSLGGFPKLKNWENRFFCHSTYNVFRNLPPNLFIFAFSH